MKDEELRGIYRQSMDALYEYVSRRCGGDRDLAEDITQETWLRAVREWHRRGAPQRPIAWLQTVAHNLIVNEFRRSRRGRVDSVTADQILGALESEGPHDSADIAAAVNRALARLPRGQSRLIEAFHFDRFRVQQLAELFGISERAVEGRLRRARENLRKELKSAMDSNGGLR